LFGAGLVLFNFRLLGGGDVKLLTAVSLWAGLGTVWAMLVTTAIAGGLLGLSLLLIRPIAWPCLARLPSAWSCWIPLSLAPGAGVPYGLPIAASAILAC
jgi:prepilin peptidase CpaA